MCCQGTLLVYFATGGQFLSFLHKAHRCGNVNSQAIEHIAYHLIMHVFKKVFRPVSIFTFWLFPTYTCKTQRSYM